MGNVPSSGFAFAHSLACVWGEGSYGSRALSLLITFSTSFKGVRGLWVRRNAFLIPQQEDSSKPADAKCYTTQGSSRPWGPLNSKA